jgi:hypothetical protein
MVFPGVVPRGEMVLLLTSGTTGTRVLFPEPSVCTLYSFLVTTMTIAYDDSLLIPHAFTKYGE